MAAYKVHVHGDEVGEEHGARNDEYEELLTQVLLLCRAEPP